MRKSFIAITAATIVASAPVAIASETYRLVHAIGQTEKILAKGLGQSECRRLRDERRKIVALLGVGGSVTCLPESIFTD